MRKYLIIMMAVLLLGACAKQEVKVQSEDSKLAGEAFALAENMREAYVSKDFKAFERYTTEQGLRDVNRQLGEFAKADLKFTPKWVEIDGPKLILNVAWEGAWVVGGKEREERGMAVFELTGRPLKLNRIVRANPFRNPE